MHWFNPLRRHRIRHFSDKTNKEQGRGFRYKGREYIHHSLLHPADSAFHRFSQRQKLALIFMGVFLVIAFIMNWHASILWLLAVVIILYFLDLLFQFLLIFRSFATSPEIRITDEEIATRSRKSFPRYTIFCPLYKEWQVVPQFIEAMSALDYPKNKLQVLLLLEEDDEETIEHIKRAALPSYFEMRIVPDTLPKTKPKACNYGLQFAKGEYLVIYDAEDIPDPLQLKKALLAFEKVGEKTVCIQAMLNFYNPHQNLLTRMFTAEYSVWFDLVLTGLQSFKAPIPLGGTSNHFRKDTLIALKAWDSFNVAEDCELGIRLARQGYDTALIDSETLEEANSNVANWLRQRTRWIKGYLQTYLIHTRTPKTFAQTNSLHFLLFHLLVGGKVVSLLLNPVMWVLTISYFLFRAQVGTFIESFFPTPILYLGVLSFVVGNFLYAYYYLLGCAKHGHHDLAKYIIFVPIYWIGLSIAAWIAFIDFLYQPHYWSKTHHGLHIPVRKEQVAKA